MFGNQTAILIPNPNFGHNSYITTLNKKYELFCDIYLHFKNFSNGILGAQFEPHLLPSFWSQKIGIFNMGLQFPKCFSLGSVWESLPYISHICESMFESQDTPQFAS